MSTPLATIQIDGAAELERAVQDYRALIKDDAGKALAKAARETTFAARKLFRASPPRPRRGTISAAAAARGFRFNAGSASYLTAQRSATKILAGSKSGYFKVSDVNGVLTAVPVIVNKAGRIAAAAKDPSKSKGQLLTARAQLSGARGKDLAAYRKLLTQADRSAATFERRRARVRRLLDENRIPAGAVQLNRGAIAALRTISLRESAAAGGYLGAQFLAYKGVRNIGETSFTTKDKKLAAVVSIKGDADGDAISAQIAGYLPGTAKIAQREGIVNKALLEAARSYRADMVAKLNQRASRQFGRAA